MGVGGLGMGGEVESCPVVSTSYGLSIVLHTAICFYRLVLRKYCEVALNPILSAEKTRLRKVQQPAQGCQLVRG